MPYAKWMLAALWFAAFPAQGGGLMTPRRSFPLGAGMPAREAAEVGKPVLPGSLVWALSSVPAAPTRSDSAEYFNAFAWNTRLDLSLLAVTGVSQISAQAVFDDRAPADLTALRRQREPFFDRWAAGMYRPGAATASDYFKLGVAVPLVLSGMDAWRSRDPAPVYQDVVMLSETLGLNSALNLWARSAISRPRPFVHSHRAPLSERSAPEAGGSFYSGHASAAFAMAVYTAYVFGKRHPRSRWRTPVWAVTLATAATVASLRVISGKHYPSDVVAGAAVGAGFGFAIPWLHLRAMPSGGR